MNSLLPTTLGKIISLMSRLTGRGHGSTWPGHIALGIQPDIITKIVQNSAIKIIFIVGTNGKTTTGKMITTILQKNGQKVIQNSSGANLKNGIASTLLLNTNIMGKLIADYAICEVDENNLPLILKDIIPDSIIILNLFRDQLDRYGELDSIALKWKKAFENLSEKTTLILNADDPLVATLGEHNKAQKLYFGLHKKGSTNLAHASDSIYCPRCHHKLSYKTVYYSHLGDWYCASCRLTRPTLNLSQAISPLSGTYNMYNTLAAILFTRKEGITQKKGEELLKNMAAAFGRQEILEFFDKKVQIFLSKNPISFNESLRTIHELKAKHLLLILNDRIPDGRDISWIWDVDFEEYLDQFEHITISGDRAYDLALRLQYTQKDFSATTITVQVKPQVKQAIRYALNQVFPRETLFILPTYSAMLETRKILTGKKIL